MDDLELHRIVAGFREPFEAIVFRPDAAYDHQGKSLLFLG